MTFQPVRLFAALLLVALLGAACSSSTDITTSNEPAAIETSQPAQQPADTADAPSDTAEADAPQDQEPASSSDGAPAELATTPLDYATISAGVVFTATEAIPCQLAGPVVAGFAEGRGLSLHQVTGNTCEWSEGITDTVSVHFRELAEIDADERRRLHGADDTVVDEAGPGTNAASYLDANGVTERYFFQTDTRAVFLVAETNPPVTLDELRGMADEVAGMIDGAVDEGQLWQAVGESSADALCSVWSADTLGAIFGATAVFETSQNGCNWFMEAPDNQLHEVTISIDKFDSVEIFTRNGGTDASIGDRSATTTETGIYGTLQKIAFAQGDSALLITVDSPTNSAFVDTLARNVAARLG